MIEQIACYVLIGWAVLRVQHMLPCAPLVDKIGLAALGAAPAWYLAELYTLGQPHYAGKVMLIAVALWVLPPSLRCWFTKIDVPAPIRLLIGMRK